MPNNFIISNIRTWVAFAVGAALTWLAAHFGIIIDDQSKLDAIALLFFAATYGYYLLVRLLGKLNGKFELLLGAPVKPDYPGTNLGNFVVSNIRTVVPVVVGVGITWGAAKLGIVIDDSTKMTAATLAVLTVTGVWYSVVHWIEQHWPAAGWLFGQKALPYYKDPDTPGIDTKVPVAVV
jgi:hypothetical protein